MKHTRIPLALGLALAGIASIQAAAIVPTFDTFGTLAGATFGGSGIPNDQVAISTIALLNGGSITLGLTAHQRYSNPAVSNNGAGVYSAVAGGDIYSGSNSNSDLARWNVGAYSAFDGTQGLGDYKFLFYYDTDPAVGNDVSTFGPGGPGQDSTNLGFGFFNGASATNGIDFNPEVAGEYSFALVVLDDSGAEVGRSAINVNVRTPGNVPDGGVTAVLLGFSMLGVAGLKRKFQA
jgi:hypothetical protein